MAQGAGRQDKADFYCYWLLLPTVLYGSPWPSDLFKVGYFKCFLSLTEYLHDNAHNYMFCRAQNNFRTVAGHDDRPKKCLLNQVLFSDRLKEGEKRELILV